MSIGVEEMINLWKDYGAETRRSLFNGINQSDSGNIFFNSKNKARYSMNRHSSLRSILALIMLVLVASACGKKDHAGATQVVAKVNGDEISIHQLNFKLSQMGQISPEQSKEVSKKVLDRLIDQQLIVQKAREAKLDRDPRVLQALENAKREILVQAYIEQQLSAAKKPSEAEVSEFYSKHPELFEHRHVYKLQELAVAIKPDSVAELEPVVKSAKNLSDVANWLKEKNIEFKANADVRAAEQLPIGLLSKLGEMKEGEMVIIPAQNFINVLMMAGSQEQPLTREKATPLIEQYLLGQHRAEIAKQQEGKLRQDAKIEYLGAFADKEPLAPAEAVEVNKDAKPKVQQGESKPNAPATGHIEKGLSGL